MAEIRDTLPSAVITDRRIARTLGELEETPESTALTLFDLARHEGYTLVIDPDPQGRADAVGNTGWKRVASAQLCAGNVVAITEELSSAAYCISHEIAHGKCGFNEEKEVLCEQASILAGWVGLLMNNIKTGAGI